MYAADDYKNTHTPTHCSTQFLTYLCPTSQDSTSTDCIRAIMLIESLRTKIIRTVLHCSIVPGVSITMGQGGHVPPPIFMKGDIHGNVPSPNILEVMSFRMSTRVTATVVCCILMEILCVVSQKSFNFWTNMDPAGGLPSPRPPVFSYVPPIIL